MLLSIAHRATGIFLSLGLLLLSCWLLFVASGPQTYEIARAHIQAWYSQIILMFFAFSLYLHLCNGVRHLFWDIGYGFKINTSRYSGYAVVIISIILTISTWVIGIKT